MERIDCSIPYDFFLPIEKVSELPLTICDDRITSDCYLTYYNLSNPSAQKGDWDFITEDKKCSITGQIDGETDIILCLVKDRKAVQKLKPTPCFPL